MCPPNRSTTRKGLPDREFFNIILVLVRSFIRSSNVTKCAFRWRKRSARLVTLSSHVVLLTSCNAWKTLSFTDRSTVLLQFLLIISLALFEFFVILLLWTPFFFQGNTRFAAKSMFRCPLCRFPRAFGIRNWPRLSTGSRNQLWYILLEGPNYIWTIRTSTFPLTEVSASKVPVILEKFVSKETRKPQS